MSTNSSGSSSSSRSKLYQRYDVELPAPSSGNRKRCRGWFNNDQGDEAHLQQQQLPPDQWTNIQMIRYIFKNSTLKSKLIALLVIMMLSSIIKSTLFFRNGNASINNDSETKRGPVMTKYGLRPDKMDPDSHKRSNPFAPPDHQSYMEGVLEVKRVKKRERPPPPPPPVENQQQQQQQQLEDKAKQSQRNNLPRQKRKETPEKRAKGRKMQSD